MTRTNVIRFLLVALWLCIGTSAFAQSSDEPPPADNASPEVKARYWMERGFEAEEKGGDEEARRLYLKSFKIYPSFDVAGNLGLVDFELRRYMTSAKYLEYCLDHFPTGENRDLKKMVEETFAKAKGFVGAITVKTSEPDSSILVDGEDVGFTPMEQAIYLLPGTYEVQAKSEGKSAKATVEAKAGESQELLLTLEDSMEGLPASGLEAAPVASTPNEESVERNWTPAWILGGVTVASFGTSMVFRGLAGGSKNKAREYQDELGDFGCVGNAPAAACADLDDALSRQNTQATLSNATLIASGVLAVATVAYVIYEASSTDAPTVSANVSYNGSGATFSLRGQF